VIGLSAAQAPPDAPDSVRLLAVVLPCASVTILGAVLLSWYLLGPVRTRRRARSRQDRQQAMRSLAQANGWSWQEWSTTFNRRWTNAPFARSGAKATNVLTGALHGYPVLAFDYEYEVSAVDVDHRRATVTYDWSVCVVRLPGALPPVLVTRRGPLGRMLAGLFGGDAFRRRFAVSSVDGTASRAVLNPRTRQLMVDGDLSYLVENAELLCWTRAGQTAQQILARLRHLVDIAGAIARPAA
jgi:hypothetical protein